MENQYALSEKDFQEAKREKVAKPLLWIGIISIIMFFAGLTSAVIVRKGDGNWFHYDIPSMFLYSTIIIAISSLFMFSATQAAKKNNLALVKYSVLATLILGIAFIFTQFEGFGQLVSNGIYMSGEGHNASGSFLYVIAWVHILHLVGGLVALSYVVFNAFKERYNSKKLLGLQVCSTYWHFLGAMWIYLYLFFKTII
ncbi:MAG: hypothetical protein DWP98_10690 [Bacteroidetes bacterium]|nr:MAG: hypothetical protein DWP98_10690 [Bacteroidota bacterium]MBL1143330.1 hypothetical protein [Bacteroidota bacterium]MCB0801623.1 cytochrome c oxidase subunit 3 [Flavobacteriales bacterium]NOG56132.1 hypothetical protein [Bacteroidota bacterium]